MQSYIQIGQDHFVFNMPADAGVLSEAERRMFKLLVEGRWLFSVGSGSILKITRGPDTGRRGARFLPNANHRRLSWGRPDNVQGRQRIAASTVEFNGSTILVTLERPIVLIIAAKAEPVKTSSLTDLRAKLRAAIDTVNDVKRELGSDAQIRITEDGLLGVTLMMEV